MNDLIEFLNDRYDEAVRARYGDGGQFADLAAKLLIVRHAETWSQTRQAALVGWPEPQAAVYRMAMEWVLRALAQPYRDHPDYHEVWDL
jgi:hypothetical protein